MNNVTRITQPTNSGISLDDAKAIKHCLLHAFEDGKLRPGEIFESAQNLMAAMKIIDDEYFERTEMEAKLRREVNDPNKRPA